MMVWTSGCVVSRSPVTGNKRAYAYTWQQEIALGRDADQQIVAQYGLYNDQRLTDYVTRIGEIVLSTSHMRRPDTSPEYRNTSFTFRVLDSPVVNAFALPGGYIYITRGLLAHLENEAQLAMVLGHEIGHVAARHASQRALEQQLGQLGLIGGAIFGQEVLGIPAEEVLGLGSTAAQLLFLSYGRGDERESDLLGVEYAARAHYQAGEGANFFQSLKRIQTQSGQTLPSFLSTHPDPGKREETIQELAASWAQEVPMTELNREAFFYVIDGLIVGENPRHGFVENGVFYHPDMQFQFQTPIGFTVINQAQQVAMVEENQRAILFLTLSDASSAQEAGRAFANQEGLTVVENGPTRSSVLPAYYVLADAKTQDGQEVRLESYFIEYNSQVFNFLGYATRENYPDYQATFRRSMRNFARLTDPRILNVQPNRLVITTVSQTAPFRALVPSNLPEKLTPEDLAIMNQIELGQQINSGTQLKLIQ